jgi:uncharacterized protein YegP (UPF0339 family)
LKTLTAVKQFGMLCLLEGQGIAEAGMFGIAALFSYIISRKQLFILKQYKIMTKFETFTGKNNEHYFRLINEKGEVLLSSEGYTQKDGLLNGIESVKKNITLTENYEIKTASNGKHFFNLKAGNGQVISTSAMWDSKDLMNTWMKDLKTEVPQATVIEITK